MSSWLQYSVSLHSWAETSDEPERFRYLRRSDTSTGNDKVIARAHSAHCFYYILLIVGDDFYPLQLDTEGEAELGQVRRIGVDSLDGTIVRMFKLPQTQILTFPPRTSSPMIRHAAVWMGFARADVIADGPGCWARNGADVAGWDEPSRGK